MRIVSNQARLLQSLIRGSALGFMLVSPAAEAATITGTVRGNGSLRGATHSEPVAVKSIRAYLYGPAGMPMSSIVPSFSLSRLRPIFGLSWHWINRPSYQIKIRHQFALGGFEVKDGPSIGLDPIGLEWMRTIELSSRDSGVKYRMLRFDDLDVILPGFPGPSPEMLTKMYGG